MNQPFPAFCRLLPRQPAPIAASHLVRATFSPQLLQAEDFQQCAVPPVRGVAKRQAEHLAGRLCAREALRALCGQPLLPGRDTEGVPIWPSGIVGSISHSTGQAAALVARATDWRGLGIDLEMHLSVERASHLAGQILTASELQRSASLPPEAFAARVTQIFSLKESLFKALYPLVLRRFYFHDAELLEIHAQGSARLRLLLDLHPQWPAGSELSGRFSEYGDFLLTLVAIP